MPDLLPTFHIMPAGWEHQGWSGAFYPEDLPGEWRLSYYANELSEVFVPYRSWIKAELDELRIWADDVNDTFRFYLEIMEPESISLYLERADILGHNLGGFVLSKDVADRDLDDDVQSMIHRYAGKLFVISDGKIPGELFRLGSNRQMGIALSLNGKMLGSLHDQREYLEELRDKAPSNAQILLCFTDTSPPIESIIAFRQLARLMGLA